MGRCTSCHDITEMMLNERAMMALDRSPESFSPQNEFYLLCSYVLTCDPPQVGQVLTPEVSCEKKLIEMQHTT